MENTACRMDGLRPSAYIVYLKTGTSIPINKDSLVLGRKTEYSKGFSEAVDYYVANRRVSRMHAAIIRESGGYYIEDLKSTNGTVINGRRLERGGKARLHDGDRFIIGGTEEGGRFVLGEIEEFEFHAEGGGTIETCGEPEKNIYEKEETGMGTMDTDAISLRGEDAIKVHGRLTKAAVYRKGAMLTRTADIHLPEGRSVICITGVTDAVSAETIQIAMTDGVSCTQVQYDAKYKETAEERVTEKPARILDLEKQKTVVRNNLEAAKYTLKLVTADTALSRKEGFTLNQWKEYVEYILSKQEELYEKIRVLEAEYSEITEKIGKWETESRQKPVPAEVPGAVFVDVEARREGDCRLELTYYNARADWTPFYDIRVSEPEKPVSFTLKGRVRQNTGEEWENVELSLSTGRLSQSNNKPELLPWVLHQKNAYRPVPAMMSQAASPKAMPYDATVMMEDATTILKPDEKKPALSQWKPSPQNKAEQNDISMEYGISGRCSVKSGGTGSIVNVLETSANAEYVYYITPKAECSAFLTAHVQDWEKMDFLEGDANIFMGNRYVGATHINPQNIRDNFQISLGRDRNILVQRKRGTQYCSKSFWETCRGGILSTSFGLKTEKTWTLTSL